MVNILAFIFDVWDNFISHGNDRFSDVLDVDEIYREMCTNCFITETDVGCGVMHHYGCINNKQW
jgi:hypothetical protein